MGRLATIQPRASSEPSIAIHNNSPMTPVSWRASSRKFVIQMLRHPA
jgi:hypothetical protein